MIVWIAPRLRSSPRDGVVRNARRGTPMRRWHRVVDAIGGCPLVDGVEEPAELQVGELALVPQRSRELELGAPHPRHATDQLHPDVGQRVEVEGGPFGRARQLHRWHPPGPHDVVHLVVALVEHTGRLHPPVDVPPAVHPRPPHVLADGQGDRAAGHVDLVGDLHSARRGAHHQHPTLGELVGVAVRHRGERSHRGGSAPASSGTRGTLKAPVASTIVVHSHSSSSVATR